MSFESNTKKEIVLEKNNLNYSCFYNGKKVVFHTINFGKSIFYTKGYIPEQLALKLINEQYKKGIENKVSKEYKSYYEPEEREFNGKVTQY